MIFPDFSSIKNPLSPFQLSGDYFEIVLSAVYAVAIFIERSHVVSQNIGKKNIITNKTVVTNRIICVDLKMVTFLMGQI